ncbi:NTP transferase domain-containing protein [Phenylobacterium sp.]|uniref:NTP transferase domain-containing protein n=1 Tax=Phenylobacterium sp. TaxID=1871053 RepID=UPI002730D6BD|nr:NTP transferase domain-containing protein [Phenylobacterium sp.]MDP1618436.1 NTP transferase domain-containing protein [Phenylobacterium sp.]MDP1989017.1 NTP transferase domain-containing protein [Phenylobacterium sp.]
MTGFRALVLAGSRPEVDPLLAYADVAHKSLIPLQGQTLLNRVVDALTAAGASAIGVCTSHPAVIEAVGQIATSGRLTILPAADSPSLSVDQGARAMGFPLLVTTADHALLRPEWVRAFLADIPAEADIAALLAPETAVRAAAPDGKRTYLAFRDGRYSGCNLFYLRTEAALSAVALWRQVEARRKQPWKIAALLGPGMLLAYLAGRLTLDQAVARLGRKAGVRACAVRAAHGLAAVDVDKPADLDLVRSLVATA